MAYKILFSIPAIIISMAAFGQEIELVNLNVSQNESKTIYIGIENKFKVNGLENLQKVEPHNYIYSIHNDVIILKPTQVGSFTLTFHTKAGTQQVNFDVKVVSDVIPAIGNLTNQLVDKNDVIAQGKLSLHSFNTKETFFENYMVSSFDVHLNDKKFSIQGEKFTDDLIEAIKQGKRGDKLIVANVKATNAGIGKTINLESKFSYELK